MTFEEWCFTQGYAPTQERKIAWSAAFAEGRRQGLEEAAVVAGDTYRFSDDIDCGCGFPCDCFGPRYLQPIIAGAIRARLEEK